MNTRQVEDFTIGNFVLGEQVDLTNCDREPIHIPGNIQPHGLILVLQNPDLKILQVSSNLSDLVGLEPGVVLGQNLAVLIEDAQIDLLKQALQYTDLEGNPLYVFTTRLKTGSNLFDAIVHHNQGLVILELELSNSAKSVTPANFYYLIRSSLAELNSSSSLKEFCQKVAQEVQQLTEFDRVMIYRFDEEWNGEVIAEARTAEIESYLGLHYPASDIPKQARALYTLNWIRIIPTINYQAAHLVPAINPITNRPLDMSYSILRSVSTVHLEYLHNMGVGASMSISILDGDKLWGLIACHHHSPKFVSYDIRAACEFLGQVVSLHLSAKEENENIEEEVRLKTQYAELVEAMARAQRFVEGLTKDEPKLVNFLNAQGVAIALADELILLGHTPSHSQITQLIEWLAEHTQEEVFQTNALLKLYPEAENFKAVASGLLAICLSRSQKTYLLWFRPEVIQTVSWGGDPNKAMLVAEDGERLTPRKSFAIWKETVYGKSLAWQSAEIAIARKLRQVITEIIFKQMSDLTRLNHELALSNVELDAFAYVTSHDLREPLRGIRNYSQILIEDYQTKLDEEGVSRLNMLKRLTQRMEDLIESLLHYSRVGRVELSRKEVDLQELLQETLEMLEFSFKEKPASVRIPQPLPKIYCDRVRVGELFSNLIVNALKYNDKAEKWVEIGFLPQQPTVFYVRDNGIGIREKHYDVIFRIFKRLHGQQEFGGGTGAGLTIVRKIVERHGGNIWVESAVGQGSTFYFTLAPNGV